MKLALAPGDVVILARDAMTGQLTYRDIVRDRASDLDGLRGTTASAVSPDGNHLYIAGEDDDAVALWFGTSPNYRTIHVRRGEEDEVYEVRDVDLLRNVALKRVSVDRNQPDMLARFIEEAQISAQLEHPSTEIDALQVGDVVGGVELAHIGGLDAAAGGHRRRPGAEFRVPLAQGLR